MKVAFLCEGDSECKSIPKVLKILNFDKFNIISDYKKGFNDDLRIGVYIHNYKGVNNLRREYLGLSSILINKYHYDKIFVWFDLDNKNLNLKICEYAQEHKNRIKEKFLEKADKIELLIAVRFLEDWYFASLDILSIFLGIDKDCLKKYAIPNKLDVNKELRNLQKQFNDCQMPNNKIERAVKFFSVINKEMILNSNSHSLKRFYKKIDQILE
jgi:hypothetical protein